MKRSINRALANSKNYPSNQNHPKYFTKNHQWIQQIADSETKSFQSKMISSSSNINDKRIVLKIGITKHKSKTLPENIVYLSTEVIQDMIERKEEITRNEEILELEGLIDSEIRALDSFRSPVGGTVLSLNEKLREEEVFEDFSRSEFGRILRIDPENEGYICELALESKREIEQLLSSRSLISENDYLKLLAENEAKECKDQLKGQLLYL